MIFTFKSGASANVIMPENDSKQILRVLGKDLDDAKGVITVEQLPGAISSLQTAINGEKAVLYRGPVEDDADDKEVETGEPVFLFQRAIPILEMLERSLKENVPVTWGV